MKIHKNDGTLVASIQNVVSEPVNHLLMSMLGNKYVFCVDLVKPVIPVIFGGDRDTRSSHNCFKANHAKFQSALFITDLNLVYLKHKFLEHDVSFLAAHDLNIITTFDVDLNCHFYNAELDSLIDKPFKKIIENTELIMSIAIGATHIFTVCTSAKMRIFDIESLEMVKKIDAKAKQIKLASNNYIVLFNRFDRMVYLYDQHNDHELLGEVNLSESIELKLWMATDTTEDILLYDNSTMTIIKIKN
jgi:hypothetical protein